MQVFLFLYLLYQNIALFKMWHVYHHELFYLFIYLYVCVCVCFLFVSYVIKRII